MKTARPRASTPTRPIDWAWVGVLLYLLLLGLPIPPKIPLLLLLLAATYQALRGHGQPARGLTLTLLAFAALSGLSLLRAEDLPHALASALSLIPAALVYWIIAAHAATDQWVALVRTLAALIGLLSLAFLGVSITHSGLNPTQWMSLAGYPQLGVPNDLILLPILSPLLLARLLTTASKVERGLLLLCLAGLLAVTVVYQSRGALLLFFLATGTTSILLRPNRGWLLSLAAALTAIGLDALQGFSLSAKFLHVWDTRLPLWASAWAQFQQAPWLGSGPGSFALLEANGGNPVPWLQPIHQDLRHAPWPHQLYLEVLAERGILAFGCLIYALGLGLHHLLTTWRSTHEPSQRALTTAVGISLLGVLVAGLFEWSLVRYLQIVVLGLLLGLSQWGGHAAGRPDAPTSSH